MKELAVNCIANIFFVLVCAGSICDTGELAVQETRGDSAGMQGEPTNIIQCIHFARTIQGVIDICVQSKIRFCSLSLQVCVIGFH